MGNFTSQHFAEAFVLLERHGDHRNESIKGDPELTRSCGSPQSAGRATHTDLAPDRRVVQ